MEMRMGWFEAMATMPRMAHILRMGIMQRIMIET